MTFQRINKGSFKMCFLHLKKNGKTTVVLFHFIKLDSLTRDKASLSCY